MCLCASSNQLLCSQCLPGVWDMLGPISDPRQKPVLWATPGRVGTFDAQSTLSIPRKKLGAVVFLPLALY